MSNHIEQAIADLEERLKPLEVQATEIKTAINQLCKVSGLPERYTLGREEAPTQIRNDQFYGQPLATCVRTFLVSRKAAGHGAASVGEIYSALLKGGYQFDSKNEDYSKRGLRQSLTKNGIFHKLPNGNYGLTEWYPNAKERKSAAEPVADATADLRAVADDHDDAEEGEKT